MLFTKAVCLQKLLLLLVILIYFDFDTEIIVPFDVKKVLKIFVYNNAHMIDDNDCMTNWYSIGKGL